MDTVKVRMQTMGCLSKAVTDVARGGSNPSISLSGIFRNTIAQEGIFGIYRGIAAPLLAVTPAFALTFWSKDLAMGTLRSYSGVNSREDLPVKYHCLAGASTSLPAAFFICPSERIKCLMQVQGKHKKYDGMLDCAKKVLRAGGLRSLYKGFGVTLLRDTPGNAAFFGTYELTKKALTSKMNEGNENPEKLSFVSVLIAGGVAGTVNWIIALPMDVVKSRFQTAPDDAFRGSRHVFQHIIKYEGVSSLYRGLTPALMRACPANAATVLGVELAISFLEKIGLR